MPNHVRPNVRPTDDLAEQFKRINQRLASLERAANSGDGVVSAAWTRITTPGTPHSGVTIVTEAWWRSGNLGSFYVVFNLATDVGGNASGDISNTSIITAPPDWWHFSADLLPVQPAVPGASGVGVFGAVITGGLLRLNAIAPSNWVVTAGTNMSLGGMIVVDTRAVTS